MKSHCNICQTGLVLGTKAIQPPKKIPHKTIVSFLSKIKDATKYPYVQGVSYVSERFQEASRGYEVIIQKIYENTK
jgi:hypothetical protein